MPSWKKVIVSGSDALLNSLKVTLNVTASSFTGSFTGSLLGTSSYTSNADLLDGFHASVFATTGSNIFKGSETISGSLLITGSTTISGSHNINNPTNKIYGDLSLDGAISFQSVVDDINPSISGSYIFMSGSTNDLYFSQNTNGYTNTTRLRWLEGNLYTGLLNGGLISATTGSTTFDINSGSGIIVTMNASLNDAPYPTVKYINWAAKTGITLPYLTSSIQTFVGIDSNGNVLQQTTPWNGSQYNTSLSIGTILHQNKSTINASITYPNVAYGYKQRTYDFIKAFGPLKLSGLSINTSSSLGLTIGSGTAWAEGRNYQVDPNNPSYITDAGTSISKIFRYYQSGSEFVQDTNNGIGYTTIDPANYNNNGTLTPVPGTGANRQYSVQRVFWYPNSATKGIVVYYGNTTYPTLTDAVANIPYETFYEVENTKQNAVYLGAIAVRNNGTFNDSTSFTILPGGIFRQVGGTGGGGTAPAARFVDLADVTITSPTDYQPAVFNTTLNKWVNSSIISGSLKGNADTSTSASYAQTSSYANNFTVAGTLTAQTLVVQTITSSIDFVTGSSKFGSITANTHQFTGSVTISGSLNVNGFNIITSNQTSSMSVATASYWSGSVINAATASYVLNAVSASYWSGSIINAATASYVQNAQTASYVITAQTASYILNATSASYAETSSFSNNFKAISLGLGNNNINVTTGYGNYISYVGYPTTGSVDSSDFWIRVINLSAIPQRIRLYIDFNADNSFSQDEFEIVTSGYGITNHIFRKATTFYNTSKVIGILTSNPSSANQEVWLNIAGVAANGTINIYSNVTLDSLTNIQTSKTLTKPTKAGGGTELTINNTKRIKYTIQTSAGAEFNNEVNINGSLLISGSSIFSGPLTATQGITGSLNSTIIGTNDNQSLNIRTNGTTRLTIGNTGTISAVVSASSRPILENTFLDLHPESVGFNILPFYANDIAYNTLCGGTFTGTPGPGSTVVTSAATAEAMFDGSATYAGFIASALSGSYTASIAFPQSFSHRNTIGFSFGNDGWRARDFKVEILVTGSYVTLDTVTGFTGANYNKSFNYGSNAVQGARITFSNFVATADNFRIADIFLLNFNSQLGKTVFLGRDGGSIYKSLIVTGSVTANNGFTGSLFGTASYALQALTSLNANTASYVLNAVSSSYAATSSYANNFTVAGTLTAQTLVVQTITSSILEITGSNQFGTTTANTHEFTGSVDITGSLTVNNNLLVTGSVIAAGAIARSTYINPALIAAANNDTLVGLDINPIWNTGSFTGVTPLGLRIKNPGGDTITIGQNNTFSFVNEIKSSGRLDIISNNNQMFFQATNAYFNAPFILTRVGDATSTATQQSSRGFGFQSSLWNGSTAVLVIDGFRTIPSTTVNRQRRLSYIVDLNTTLNTGGTEVLAIFSSGSVVLQNGGTFTDAGFRLDVSGSTRLNGAVTVVSASIQSQNTSSLASSTQTISTNATSSYTAAFYNYTLASGSNTRAGQFIATWNGNSIQYTDNSTVNIGNTSTVALTASLSGGNILLTSTLPSTGWTVKTLVNLI